MFLKVDEFIGMISDEMKKQTNQTWEKEIN